MALKRLRLYIPHRKQLEFHALCALHRFVVCAWSRQTGKSTGANNQLLKWAWEYPKCIFWFVAPTYAQATIQYRRMIQALAGCPGVIKSKSESELRIELVNGSAIFYKSGDKPDNLRAEAVKGMVIDEVRDQDPNLWPLVLRPMLGTTRGFAIFISTPNGFDAFYDLFERAGHDPEWGRMQVPATEVPELWSPEEIASAKKDMTPEQFAQEIMAQFLDVQQGRVYSNYGHYNLVDQNPFAEPGQLWSPYLPIGLACDFNLSPMAWTLGQHRHRDFYWGKSIHLVNSHTIEGAEVVRDTVLVEHPKIRQAGITICGDATGKAGQRAAAGQSDYNALMAVLKAAGIPLKNATPEANPTIKDRVNAVNVSLKDGGQQVHQWLHRERCKPLKMDYERCLWKETDHLAIDPGPKRELGHASDGVGYFIHHFAPIAPARDPGKLRVIFR